MIRNLIFLLFGLLMVVAAPEALGEEMSPDAAPPAQELTIDEKINEFFKKPTEWAYKGIFFKPFSIGGMGIPFILIWLVAAGIFLTFFFKFINLRSFGLAFRTVRGKYSSPDDPGEITHFQALTTALGGVLAGAPELIGLTPEAGKGL